MWFIIIIGAIISTYLIPYLYDYRLKTNEVEIRICETSYSFKDSLWYKCQFKKKGGLVWTNFVEYSNCFANIRAIGYQDPKCFYKFKDYTYKQCIEFNDRAYELESEAIKKRKANRNIKVT